jgi:hypothetical protein
MDGNKIVRLSCEEKSFCLLLLKTVTNLEDCSEASSKILFRRLSFPVIDDFFFHGRLSE